LLLQALYLALHAGGIVQVKKWIDDECGGRRGGSVRLGYNAVMSLLQVLFHLIRTRKFLLTDRTWKHLSLLSFMIEEGMSLEAVLVLEVLANLHFFALYAPVGPVRGD
jgi:hypothetical protein